MWHKPYRTFHPWYPCIKTRCLSIIDFASGEVLNFGLKVRSSLTLRMGIWASTGSKDYLNVSLKAAIDILFICLWYYCSKQSCHLRLLVGQRDLAVTPYIAGEGATIPRTSSSNLNAIAAARVSQGSHTLKTETQGNGLSMENQGIYQAPQGIFENSKISGNS